MSDIIKMNILNSPNEIDDANSAYFISRTNPIAYELDGNANIDSLRPVKKRTVRLVYCGDGVIEECDEDDEEKERLEQEEKQRQIDLQKQLDEQAVSAHFHTIKYDYIQTEIFKYWCFELERFAVDAMAWLHG